MTRPEPGRLKHMLSANRNLGDRERSGLLLSPEVGNMDPSRRVGKPRSLRFSVSFIHLVVTRALTRVRLVPQRLLATVAIALTAPLLLPPVAIATQESSLSGCLLHAIGSKFSGLCGPLLPAFNHVPTVTLERVKSIQTGLWRDDVRTDSLYSGSMEDEADPKSAQAIELEVYPGGWGLCIPMRDGFLRRTCESRLLVSGSIFISTSESRLAPSIEES